MMRWVGHVACTGKMRTAYSILIGKSKGKKRRLGRSRSRWEDIIGMDIREIACERVDWMHLAENRD
jgi:hypothetical protein